MKKKPVTGMKDILPREMEIRDYAIGLIKETYRTGLMKYTEGELNGIFGDSNSDGTIDLKDAQLVLNWYVNEMAHKDFGEGVTYAGSFRIDVNLDSEVSIEDAQFILNYYVKNSLSGKKATWAEITGNENAPKE